MLFRQQVQHLVQRRFELWQLAVDIGPDLLRLHVAAVDFQGVVQILDDAVIIDNVPGIFAFTGAVHPGDGL